MRIQRATLDSFGAFGKVDISPSRGLNVFLGENGTGKTHLMKLLYALLRVHPFPKTKKALSHNGARLSAEARERYRVRLSDELERLFQPYEGRIGRLVRRDRGRKSASVEVSFASRGTTRRHGAVSFTLDTRGDLNATFGLARPAIPSSRVVFIPSHEVLTTFQAAASLIEEGSLELDGTYRDLAAALARPAPRGNPSKQRQELLAPLRDALSGFKVELRDDEFFVNVRGQGRFEAHLVAEGHRKLAALYHLIANGRLTATSVLFWDEPEANLNPRLVTSVVELLFTMAAKGVQVFVSTHDYLLSNEISIRREYEREESKAAAPRFFLFGREDGAVGIVEGESLSAFSSEPILDEFTEHYEREQRYARELERKHTERR